MAVEQNTTPAKPEAETKFETNILDKPIEPIIDQPAVKTKRVNKKIKTIITVVIIIAVLVVAGFLVNKYTSLKLFGDISFSKSGLVLGSQDSYSAVFLSNGQVYFGKIVSQDESYTVIEDIYYLQVQDTLQPTPPEGTTSQPQLSLVKLGNELHGPKDSMTINSQHILFTEELKADSKVVEAIINYKAGNQAGAL